MVHGLKSDFVAAEINRDDKRLESLAAQIRRSLSSPSGQLNVPLDLRGTAFQQMVWKELRRIPRGETRSYAEVARTIGRPKAVRAVANACASNPVALVVPCHRVVHKNGNLSGYRWGVKRKAALLEKERQGQPR
jgi:AraC family transcriptional regulator of adaptative response/methylated-DNA-[protein]-cysteine methyltransferase